MISNVADITDEHLMEVLMNRKCGVGPFNIHNEHIVARDIHGRSCLHIALSKTRDYYDVEHLLDYTLPHPRKAEGWPSLYGLENIIDKSLHVPWNSYYEDNRGELSDIPISLDLVKQLIDAGADVNALDSGCNSCLHYAAENEDCYDLISLLIQSGAKVDSLNHCGDSPLLTAVKLDNLKAVERLIEHGANINASNNHGETVLHLAGKDAMLCFLLKAGCTVPMNQTNKCGCSPFLAAIEYCGVQTLEKMIQAGADVNFKHAECDRYDCPRHQTPLCVALNKNREATVETLLKHGANPSLNPHKNWNSTLYYAALFAGSRSHNGIFIASEDEKSANILQLMILHGADICNDLEAFKAVIEHGSLRAVQLCFNEFYRKGVRMPASVPLLHTALPNKRDDVFKFVLESSFQDIDQKDEGGYTVLHRAIRCHTTERAHMLLNYGADVNTSNNQGDTALQAALEYHNGSGVLLMLLLMHGSLSSWRTDISNLDIRFFKNLLHQQYFQQKIQIIVMHFALIENFGYPIAPSFLNCIMNEYPESIKKVYEDCKTEIGLSRFSRVNRSISVHDLLTNVDHRHARNESQVEKFIDENVHEQFPVYQGLIRYRFGLSKQKSTKVSRAIKGLSRILRMDYQTFYNIYDNIFCRLRSKDLLILERI